MENYKSFARQFVVILLQIILPQPEFFFTFADR